MQNQIENVCGCGECYTDLHGNWRLHHPGADYRFPGKHCSICGWALGDDGWARRTVVLPEEVQIIRYERYSMNSENVCGPHYLIPVPQEYSDG